jgi:hypothetical protein
MTPFTAGFCIILSSMSLTATLSCLPLRLPHAVHLPAVPPTWRRPMLRIYTTADALSLSDVWRNTIKSSFRKLLQKSSLSTVGFFIFSIGQSTDRSIELASSVPTSLHTKCRRAHSLFSNRENMHFRSTDFVNSLLTLRSRRPFERVFFFFLSSSTRSRNGPSPCADLTE